MSRPLIVIAFSLVAACGATQQPSSKNVAADSKADSVSDSTQTPCFSSSDCPDLQFCNTEGQASCDSIGVCAPKGINLFCSMLYIGICGCDGQTYANGCVMHKAGVAKAYDGACQQTCQSNSDCGDLSYCQFPDGFCGGDGVCAPRGVNLDCANTPDSQCGCDGVTYGSTCLMHKAGQSLAYAGGC